MSAVRDFSSCVAGRTAMRGSSLIIKSLDFQQYRSLRGNYFVHAVEEGRRLV